MSKKTSVIAALLCCLLGCSVQRSEGDFPELDAGALVDMLASDMTIEDEQLDLDGPWLLFTEDRRCIYPDLGDQVENIVWSFYRLDMSSSRPDSPLLTIDAQMCHQYLSPLPFGFVTVVPRSVISVLSPLEFSGFLTTRSTGVSFVTEPVVDAWGYQEGTSGEGIPQTVEDERVYDQDEDGAPGVTLQIETVQGMSICEVKVVQRTRLQLEGSIRNGSLIGGALNVEPEQVVLEASSALCAGGEVTSSLGINRFELVKLPADLSTCAAIREALPRVRRLLDASESTPDAPEFCPSREMQ